jgi:hypothetical protein
MVMVCVEVVTVLVVMVMGFLWVLEPYGTLR